MLNEAKLIGNLGADPDNRVMPNGSAVVTLSLATTRKWKNKQSGESEEHTEWHRVVVFNKLAEICSQYLRKGSQIYISGRIETKKWTKDGVDRYSTQIVANEMTMLGSRPADGSAASWAAPANQPPRQQQQQPPVDSNAAYDYVPF